METWTSQNPYHKGVGGRGHFTAHRSSGIEPEKTARSEQQSTADIVPPREARPPGSANESVRAVSSSAIATPPHSAATSTYPWSDRTALTVEPRASLAFMGDATPAIPDPAVAQLERLKATVRTPSGDTIKGLTFVPVRPFLCVVEDVNFWAPSILVWLSIYTTAQHGWNQERHIDDST